MVFIYIFVVTFFQLNKILFENSMQVYNVFLKYVSPISHL